MQLRTKKTGFEVATGQRFTINQNNLPIDAAAKSIEKEKYIGSKITLQAIAGQPVTISNYAANISSQNYPANALSEVLKTTLKAISEKGFDKMLAEQAAAWEKKWLHNDIIIEGDTSAQQGIRFNIFQQNQT